MSSIEKNVRFPGVKDGETFRIGGMEFIKFPDQDGKTPVVMRDVAFNARFGDSNDLRSSEILRKLVNDILPKIIAEVGEDAVCTFQTDLTTLDGLKPYAPLESKISLPTLDFYRANVEIFDKHKIKGWWWLATPDSARPHYDPVWILCVSPAGRIINDIYDYRRGVRPILILKSSIFGSSEE